MKKIGVSTLLSDSLSEFVILSEEPNANLHQLLGEFESDLKHYAEKFWGYSPKVFPLLRKAARSYVAGKLSIQALNAVCDRTLLCYMPIDDSEEALIEDLRGYIRAKPINDLPAVVKRMVEHRREIYHRGKQQEHRVASLPPNS